MKDSKISFTLILVLLLLLPFVACSSPKSNAPGPVPTPPPVGKTLQIYRGHGGAPVFSIAWEPSGHLLASAGMDGRVNLWESSSGKTVRTYTGVSGQLLWSHDGKRIAVTTWTPILSKGATLPISILDATSNKILLILAKPSTSITRITWSPDNTRIASLSMDGEVQIWESGTGKLLKSYTAHRNVIDSRDIAWSPDGKYIASTSTTASNPLTEVTIWNTMTNETAFVYRLPVASLSWSSNSTRLLSTGDENMVIIWDVTTGKTLLRYKGHSDSVSSAAWSPDEQDIASAGKDKVVQIFNAKTGKTIFTYKGHQQDIFDVAWSPSGKVLASCDTAGNVHVWQAL